MRDEMRASMRSAADEARALLAQNLPAEAVRVLRAYLRHRRGAATEHALMGVALVQCGELAAGAKALEGAVARDRRNAALYLTLGQVYLQQGRIREALAAFEKSRRTKARAP